MNVRVLVQEVRKKEFLFAFFDFLLIMLPGAGILYVFERATFLSVDWIKLLLLSGAMMAPLVFFNILVMTAWDDEPLPKNKDTLFFYLTVSCMISSLLLYVAALVSYLWQGTSVRYFIVFAVGLEAGITVIAVIKEWLRKKRKKRAKTPSTK